VVILRLAWNPLPLVALVASVGLFGWLLYRLLGGGRRR
jgi:hypothetical protein